MSNALTARDHSQSAWQVLRRVVRIALDPRKLALAGSALALLWCGNWVISQLPFGEETPAVGPWALLGPIPNWGGLLTGIDGWIALFETTVLAARRILAPIGPLLEVAGLPFSDERSWSELALLWTRFFWSLAVWSVFGGAIARLAAVEFAKGERESLWGGFSFALRRFLSFFTAPLLPIAAVLLLWGLCALGGLLGSIPYVGEMVLALLWGLGFVFGLLIVLIALASCAGWPLMVAGIAAEGSDAFDGFSRSFSYLYGRPWLFGGCVAVALAMGGLFTLVVEQAAVLVATTTDRVVSTFHQSDTANVGPVNLANEKTTYQLGDTSDLAGKVVTAWHGLLFLLTAGFSVSFFWSASTVIYFLLRRADDGTHLDEVWLGDATEEADLMPLAGIAATGQPVTERSHHPTVGEE